MIDLERLKGEYTMLSYLVFYAERARDVMRRAMVSDAMFTLDENRTAFAALMQETTEDSTLLFRAAGKSAPAIDEASYDAFYGLSSNPGALEHETERFAETAIMREYKRDVQQTLVRLDGVQAELPIEAVQRLTRDAQTKINKLRAEFPMTMQQDKGGGKEGDALDENLLYVPGFVNELTEYSMRAAPRPNRVTSFAGALALLAHLAGRKFVGPSDARPNIYLNTLANSGVGKDSPRQLNRNIANAIGMEASVRDTVASGQGLEDALARTPALLMQMDEFDTVLNVLKDKKGNSQANEAMWNVMLNVFSASNSSRNTRDKAATAHSDGAGKIVRHPSFTLFATAVPGKFYGALSERAHTNGLLARCIVVEAGSRGERNFDSGFASNPIPDGIMKKVQHLANRGHRLNDSSEIKPFELTKVPFADNDAMAEATRINSEADGRYKEAVGENSAMEMSVWIRSLELTMKFALLYAISEGIGITEEFAITRNAMAWAWKFVKACQLRMLKMTRDYTAETEFEENVKKALRIIQEAGPKGITKSKFSRNMHLKPGELREVVQTLVERDDIVDQKMEKSNNGKEATLYIAVATNDRKKGK